MNIIEENLLNYLKKFNLINKKIIVGFSGGGDSTALIIALNKIKKIVPEFYFEAFHVNYGLRIESDKDEQFVKNICNNYSIKPFELKDNNYLLNYNWPGNIRELRNLIERVTILSQGQNEDKILNIIKESLSQSESDKFSISETLDYPLREARENFEKEYLTTQLKKFGGNISKTAKFVGMERSALHRKLKGLGVKDLN